MMFNFLRKISFVVAFVAMSFAAQAQSTYNKAVDLYNKGVFVEAQQMFQQARSGVSSTDKTKLSNIDFYNAMCALKLKQSNAEVTAQNFVDKYPDSKLRNNLLFSLGTYCYDTKKAYREAKNYFEKVKHGDLSLAEQGEYDFKYGYTLLKANDENEALQHFANAKENMHTRYASQAEYYYAHILYEQKKYAAALSSFEKLKHDADFADLVPYYILQIYFYQENYDRVISDGEAFYPKAAKNRQGEVARVLAEAYLRKGNNEKAREYFAKYEKATSARNKKISDADSYLMAYTDFEAGKYTDASQKLQRITIKNDTLSQKVLYLLGGAYANSDNKTKALAAFERAGKMNFDQDTKVDAQFNYAKLALELNSDSKPMSDFLAANKSKANDPQIREFLVKSYLADKKFDEAIDLIEGVQNPSEGDYRNLQKATYYAGLEQFKNKKADEAIKLLNTSLKYSKYDENLASLAEYWKSEALYSQKKYAEAADGLKKFMNSNVAKTTNEYKMAHYTMGYCQLGGNNYSDAETWFKKYITLETSSKNPYVADCYNRIGDCRFKQRDYKKAGENYSRAYELKSSNPDYALYQGALSMGMLNDNNRKKIMLNNVASQFPTSRFAPAALFELGRTYVQQQDYTNAEKEYKQILSKYNTSTYYRQALIELGLININNNKSDDALKYYKRVVDEYPKSPEAQTALAGIKDIYVDNGNINEYFAYADKKNMATGETDRDSLSFAAAERIYLLGDCDKSITALSQYLQNYPNGQNAMHAHFYAADCLYRNKKYAESAVEYEKVMNSNNSEFLQDATRRYALAKYQIEDYKNAAPALERVAAESTDKDNVKDAQILAMRAYSKIENYESAAAMAEKVAKTTTDDEIKREALITQARSLQELDKNTEAVEVFKKLTNEPKTAEGAEATYNVIDDLYQNGKASEAEKMIYKFAESKTTHDSWLARSFIILANINIDKKDYFQAKATLNSVLSNYKRTDDGILDEAKDTLETIKDK